MNDNEKEYIKFIYSDKTNFDFTKEDFIKKYYTLAKDFKSPHIKATVSVEIPDSILDRLETHLAKVSNALDNLLSFLHDKKNS